MSRRALVVPILLSLLLLPAMPLPAASRAAGPIAALPSYEPSPAVHEVVAETDGYVPAPDGTQVQVDVYRPAAAGRFPAVVWFDVYYKDDPNAVVNGERDYFVSRGYVFVHASSPGSNNSGGSYDSPFSIREQQAATAVVEWAARQPWSTGDVGMNGLSYAAIIQYFVGANRPEGLRTLYPASAYSDLYREITHIGGQLQTGYPVYWDLNNRTLAYLPPLTTGPAPATDLGNWAGNVIGWRPIAADFVQHPYADGFYAERSPVTRNHEITVPFALDVGWSDDMVHGGPINFETVGSEHKRLVIGPWGHSATHRRDGGRFERLRWYDRWLKGLPSGVECDPPVRLFISRGGKDAGGGWHSAQAWPLTSTRMGTWYLTPDRALRAEPSDVAGTASYRYLPGRVDRYEGVSFTTAPLGADTTVVGYGEVVLFGETANPDTSWHVSIEDVAPDGSRTVLQRGWLRASMREVDEARSRPGRPHHAFQREVAVPANTPVEYRIGLWPFANTFPKGHAIRVVVNDNANGASGGVPVLMAPHPGTNVVHAGGDTPSRVLLPVVDLEDLSRTPARQHEPAARPTDASR
jgi:uncharacterized protein